VPAGHGVPFKHEAPVTQQNVPVHIEVGQIVWH
jgi:hypothetical protein